MAFEVAVGAEEAADGFDALGNHVQGPYDAEVAPWAPPVGALETHALVPQKEDAHLAPFLDQDQNEADEGGVLGLVQEQLVASVAETGVEDQDHQDCGLHRIDLAEAAAEGHPIFAS